MHACASAQSDQGLCVFTVEKTYMKYVTASKKTYDQQSSRPACACVSIQFKDLFNKKTTTKKKTKQQNNNNKEKKKTTKKRVRPFCPPPTQSSTGPAYDSFFFS